LDKSFVGLKVLTVTERMDKALVWFGKNVTGPQHAIVFSENKLEVRFDFLASTSAPSNSEDGILQLLHDIGYLRAELGHPFSHYGPHFLTASGWTKFDELQRTSGSSSQAFVAMWFSPELDVVYEKGFYAAIEDAGYAPMRIDRAEHNNKIDDEIIAEIRRSRFVVADFTSEIVERKNSEGQTIKDTHARGGVYFEAGFARGLGKEVIWCVREDVLPLVHFDTRQFSHIVWKDIADLREKLSRRISATIGDGPFKKPD
jgi:hypothetical protein